jgi:hypothetical protein
MRGIHRLAFAHGLSSVMITTLSTGLNRDVPFCSYEMIPLEEQVEIAQQIGTTRAQILSNLNDLTLGTSFL